MKTGTAVSIKMNVAQSPAPIEAANTPALKVLKTILKNIYIIINSKF